MSLVRCFFRRSLKSYLSERPNGFDHSLFWRRNEESYNTVSQLRLSEPIKSRRFGVKIQRRHGVSSLQNSPNFNGRPPRELEILSNNARMKRSFTTSHLGPWIVWFACSTWSFSNRTWAGKLECWHCSKSCLLPLSWQSCLPCWIFSNLKTKGLPKKIQSDKMAREHCTCNCVFEIRTRNEEIYPRS